MVTPLSAQDTPDEEIHVLVAPSSVEGVKVSENKNVAPGLSAYQYGNSVTRGFDLSELPNTNWNDVEKENMQRRAAYRLANALNCQEEAVLSDLFWLLGFSVYAIPGNPNPADLYAEGSARHKALMGQMTSESGYYPEVPDEKRKDISQKAYAWLIKVSNLWSNKSGIDLDAFVEKNSQDYASLSSLEKKERVLTQLKSKIEAHPDGQFVDGLEREFANLLKEGKSIAQEISGNCQKKSEIYNYKGLYGSNSKKSYPQFRGIGYGPADVNPKGLKPSDVFKGHAQSASEVKVAKGDTDAKHKFLRSWAYRSHGDLACLATEKKKSDFEESRYLLGAQLALNPADLTAYYRDTRGDLGILDNDLKKALGGEVVTANGWVGKSSDFWGKELPKHISDVFPAAKRSDEAKKFHVQKVIDLTRHLRRHSQGREAHDAEYDPKAWIEQHQPEYAPMVEKLAAIFDQAQSIKFPQSNSGNQCKTRKSESKAKPILAEKKLFTEIQGRAEKVRATITHVGSQVKNLVNRCPAKVQNVLDDLKKIGKVFCYERKGLIGALVAGAGHTGGGTYNNNWRRHGHAKDLPQWTRLNGKKRPYTGKTGDNTVHEGGLNVSVGEAIAHHAGECFPYNKENHSGIKNVVKANHFGEIKYGEVNGLANYGNQTTRFSDGSAGYYYNALNKRYNRSIYIEPHFNSNDDYKANAHVLAALKKNPSLSLSQISGYNSGSDQAQVYYKRGRTLDGKLAKLMGQTLHSSMSEGGYVSKAPLVAGSGYSTFSKTLAGNNRTIAVLVECAAMDGTKGAPRLYRDMTNRDYQVRLKVERAKNGQSFQPTKIRYGRELSRTEAIIPKVALKCSEGILAGLAQMPEYQKTEAECKKLNGD